MNNFKWSTESFNDKPINIVLFVSRNKDNKDVPNFVERRKSFITTKDISFNTSALLQEFINFTKEGVDGEMSRMYVSVNSRDGQKIHKQLLHFLIDNPDFNLCSIQSKLAGIAAQKDCAKEKKWLFDFDINNYAKANEFMEDIKNIEPNIDMTIYFTPNGYAIVTNRGFDTRKLFEKWTDNVTLKRDAMLCFSWHTNGEEEND